MSTETVIQIRKKTWQGLILSLQISRKQTSVNQNPLIKWHGIKPWITKQIEIKLLSSSRRYYYACIHSTCLELWVSIFTHTISRFLPGHYLCFSNYSSLCTPMNVTSSAPLFLPYFSNRRLYFPERLAVDSMIQCSPCSYYDANAGVD